MTRVRLGFALSALALVACQGEGSDIGPDLEPLPEESYRLVVHDDLGRGVVNAAVTLSQFPDEVGRTRRSGRFDFFVVPSGRRVVAVSAVGATAASGDRLGSLSFAADMVPGDQLPFVVHLPDLAGSAEVEVPVGVPVGSQTLDDTGRTDVVLGLAEGTVVGGPAGAASVVLRVGTLRADHIPPLQLPGGVPALASRGVFVDPPEATFAPGASLILPDDLGLSSGSTPTLYRLEPSDGEWRAVGTGTWDPATSTIRTGAGGVPGGGLYAFAVPAPAVATVVGTAVERQLGQDLPPRLAGLRVRVGQVFAVSDGGGRFLLGDVPVSDASGVERPVVLSLVGGRHQRPSTEERQLTPAAGSVLDLGEVELDIVYATDMRIMLIERGRVVPLRGFAVGSRTSDLGEGRPAGLDGVVNLPGIDAGFVGFLSTIPYPGELGRVSSINTVLSLGIGRNADMRLFYAREDWGGDSPENALIWAADSRTAAPLEGVHLFVSNGGVDALVLVTRPEQIEAADLRAEEAIVTLESSIEGRTVHSAFTTQSVRDARVEMPLEQAIRSEIGAFEPFGVVAGPAPGSGAMQRVRSTSGVDAEIWLAAALAGRPLDADVPDGRQPAGAGDSFEVGVPSGDSTLVAVSGAESAGRFTLADAAFAEGLDPVPGSASTIDLGAPLPFTTAFVIPGALTGRDPSIPAETFVLDVGFALPSGRVVDVAHGVGGNAVVHGEDVTLSLPALTGPLDGARHLVLWRGTSDDGAVVRSQILIAALGDQPLGERSLLALPEILEPQPGAQVSVDGFDVVFALPPDAIYGMVHIRHESAGVIRDWKTLVPPTSTRARFRNLPEGTRMLEPGRFTVEVSAARANGGLLQAWTDPYLAASMRWMGISAYERGLDSQSWVRFEVELVE